MTETPPTGPRALAVALLFAAGVALPVLALAVGEVMLGVHAGALPRGTRFVPEVERAATIGAWLHLLTAIAGPIPALVGALAWLRRGARWLAVAAVVVVHPLVITAGCATSLASLHWTWEDRFVEQKPSPDGAQRALLYKEGSPMSGATCSWEVYSAAKGDLEAKWRADHACTCAKMPPARVGWAPQGPVLLGEDGAPYACPSGCETVPTAPAWLGFVVAILALKRRARAGALKAA